MEKYPPFQYGRWDNKNYLNIPTHDEYCDCGTCHRIFIQHNERGRCYCAGCQTRYEVIVADYSNLPEERPNVSTVNFCERCESMGVSTAMGEMNYKTAPGEVVKRLELCPGCVGDLMTWLEDITTTRDKAYRKPWQRQDDVTTGDFVPKSEVKRYIKELLAGDDSEG